jgi:DNA repair photolyase
MRWATQEISREAPGTLPGLARVANLIRSVQTPEFEGMTFHEVAAKSALNRVPGASVMPYDWTINPYRGCSHACTYCFARPSHAYLGLGSGLDFDSQVVVKVNVAEVLRGELARPAWKREWVALGTNTDPYQRAEGRYRLMPGVISALARSGTPFSVLTKGTLIRRDLPLLASAARDVSASVAFSVAVFDDALTSTLEPGAPSGAARLAAVGAARAAGLEPSVFVAPILPFLTDSAEHLDEAMRRISEAGATAISYDILNLRPGVKEWFAGWLRRTRPDLVPRYRDLYGTGAYVPDDYSVVIRGRVREAMTAHGMETMRFRPAGPSAEGDVRARNPVSVPTLF